MNQIPIRTKNKIKSTDPKGVFGISRTQISLFIVCAIIYGGCEIQIQILGSETKNLQAENIRLSQDTTHLQTKIYRETQSSNFLMKVSDINNSKFSEPKDISIQYMRLPTDTTLVMR